MNINVFLIVSLSSGTYSSYIQEVYGVRFGFCALYET